MFVLVILEDKIKIDPEQFEQDPTEALIQQIELKFANKVLLNVGLCICFYDFIEVGDPYIYPSEGSSHQRVEFRLVVFRPHIGEVLIGKVTSCREDGIRGLVSMGFFDDVYIPSYLLQAPSEFREEASSWVWLFNEQDLEQNFVLSIGEEIRFRIRSIDFTRLVSSARGFVATVSSETKIQSTLIESNDTHNSFKGQNVGEMGGGQSSVSLNDINISVPLPVRKRSSSFDIPKESDIPPAMQIVGCINEDGLGLTSWW